MDKSRLERALKGIQWSVERPVFIPAGIAYELHEKGVKSNYYTCAWWYQDDKDFDLLAGFTGFLFTENNRVGQSELNILRMNRQDTAFDVPGLIDFREWIYAPNLDVPNDYIGHCVMPVRSK